MKIMFLVDDLKTGGLERSLAIAALGIDKEKFEVSVWCLIGGGRVAGELRSAGIPVSILDILKAGKPRALFSLIKLFRKETPDIIHCWGFSAGVWGRLAAVFAGVPVKISHAQNLCDALSRKCLLQEKVLAPFTDKVIACSEAVKKSLVLKAGIAAEKIEVIYNSVDLGVFEAPSDKAAVRTRLGLSQSDIVIGSVSRLVGVKGHKYLLEAFAHICRAFSRAKLLIVGEGPVKEELMRSAEELKIRDRVIFAGFSSDVPGMLSAMTVFVQPSIEREGLPLAIAEAFAAGLPVIATDVGGNAEIVEDGVTGIIVRPADSGELAGALERILKDPAAAKEMGLAGRGICGKKFLSRVMINSLELLYERLAAVRCPLCGAESAGLLYAKRDFNILRCASCAFIFNDGWRRYSDEVKCAAEDTVDVEKVKKRYESEKELYYDRFAGELSAIAEYKKPGRLLDIGSGYGYFPEMAKKRGWTVKGIDCDKSAVEFCRDTLSLDVELSRPGAPVPTGGDYDVITFFHSLEHLPDFHAAIACAKRALLPGGLIVIDVPNAGDLRRAFMGKGWPMFRPEHLWYFSRGTLERLLKRYGFKVVRTVPHGGTGISAGISKTLNVDPGRFVASYFKMLRPVKNFASKLFNIFGFSEDITVYAESI